MIQDQRKNGWHPRSAVVILFVLRPLRDMNKTESRFLGQGSRSFDHDGEAESSSAHASEIETYLKLLAILAERSVQYHFLVLP